MRTLFIVFGAVLALTQQIQAHHSVDAEIDRGQPVTFTGIVTKVEWTNPHGRVYLHVKESDGTVVAWETGTASVSMLRRIGWTRDTLKVGDTVTVSGFRARDGRRFL